MIEVDRQGTAIYRDVLDHARNLLKAFAPEAAEVEIVCHGDALDMLLSSRNPLAKELKSFKQPGVIFAACENSMRGRKITRAMLIPGVKVVDSGVAEIVRKEEAGWSYLKAD